mmetsp:Transcript_48415/g.114322  ORF Transcript_48415/g.114322 Transcript_48415/m.114322 type:complete len:273 (+) Transcript_48415:785-1603(+)
MPLRHTTARHGPRRPSWIHVSVCLRAVDGISKYSCPCNHTLSNLSDTFTVCFSPLQGCEAHGCTEHRHTAPSIATQHPCLIFLAWLSFFPFIPSSISSTLRESAPAASFLRSVLLDCLPRALRSGRSDRTLVALGTRGALRSRVAHGASRSCDRSLRSRRANGSRRPFRAFGAHADANNRALSKVLLQLAHLRLKPRDHRVHVLVHLINILRGRPRAQRHRLALAQVPGIVCSWCRPVRVDGCRKLLLSGHQHHTRGHTIVWKQSDARQRCQ